MHILLVRFSSMGDVVLQTSTANFLKALLGEKTRITFLTSEEFSSLVTNHPNIDEVIGFKRKEADEWKSLVKKIKELHEREKIHLIFDVHGTLRSFRLRLRFWYIPSLVFDKRRVERFLLTKLKIPFFKNILKAKIFGLEPQVIRTIKDFTSIFGSHLALWKTQKIVQSKNDVLTSLSFFKKPNLSSPYLVLAPSASFAPKRWPIHHFVELAKMILTETDLDVVVLAGPADDFCSAFNEVKNERLHNLQGKTSLRESMDYLAGARLCIGNDSGMNHIAEAYDVPCLTIFGPTDPLFGFAPHGQKSRYVYKNLWCSPCSTTGKKECFRSKHFCMLDITPLEVMSEFEIMLSEI